MEGCSSTMSENRLAVLLAGTPWKDGPSANLNGAETVGGGLRREQREGLVGFLCVTGPQSDKFKGLTDRKAREPLENLGRIPPEDCPM